MKKSELVQIIREVLTEHYNQYYPQEGDKVQVIYGGINPIYQGENFIDIVTAIIDETGTPYTIISFKKHRKIKDFGEWTFKKISSGDEEYGDDVAWDTRDKEPYTESIKKSELINLIKETINEVRLEEDEKLYGLENAESDIKELLKKRFKDLNNKNLHDEVLKEIRRFLKINLPKKYHKMIDLEPWMENDVFGKNKNVTEALNYLDNLVDDIENEDEINQENIKKNNLIDLIKETINELNVKKIKDPIPAQVGVLMSDGSVETFRVLSGNNIESMLKNNYSTYKQIQSLLDYGDVKKLGTTSGNTVFLERDLKKRGSGTKLKNDLKSFVNLCKVNKARKIYLFDLTNKQWKVTSQAKIDLLLT